MTPSTSTPARIVNGIAVDALRDKAAAIRANPALGRTRWSATTRWVGGTRSDTKISESEFGGERLKKDFTLRVDEPLELCGTNQHANPLEYLLAAMNASMTVGYIAQCALAGIVVKELTIETSGAVDLRGFLGLDDKVKAGFDELVYTVHLKADATPVQLERVHDAVCRTSPNLFNLSQPVRLRSRLVTG
jgi:uncharacterized OsmC-like protein